MAPSIKINVQFVDEPSPENRARIEFYTKLRRLELGEFLYKEMIRIRQEQQQDDNNTKILRTAK